MAGNFRSGYLYQGTPLGATTKTVILTADDTVIDVISSPLALLKISSDSATAANRTFTITSSTIQGHQLDIIFESGSSTSAQLVDTGNLQLNGNWEPLQYDTLSLQWDGSYWIETGRSQSGAVVVGTLSQANIIAMNGAPIALIAAPGAGKAIVVDEIELFHDYSTAAYTGGGDVSIEYETSGTDVMTIDVTFVTATSDLTTLVKPTVYTSSATDTGFALSTNANKAIQITNATAVFADGNAANIIKYRIKYHVVTLLT